MIICIGEAVIDMFQKNTHDFGEVFYPLPGGCSYNTSIAIGKLGAPVSFLGRISNNFFGEIQIKRLHEHNVKTNLINRCGQNPILAIIKTDEGKQPQYAFYDEGTSDRLLSTEELPDVLPSDTTCIVFGSISMSMEPIATTIEKLIMKEAKQKVIAFDPNIRPFMIKDRDAYMERFKKWAGICTIAKISSEDFEFIFPDTEPEQALNKMLGLGTRLAIITLGEKGAMAMLTHSNGKVIKTSACAIKIPKIADTVGAGDTFHGAFLAWLELRGKMSHNEIINLSEEDLHAALVFANKAAAFVCTQYGSQPPEIKQLD
ncbi:MAG: carbohydrate kinase [Treponema sp.]|nr:carbohydrate kinase [Treponema sp.]MCL2252511.1 carbohydrate kinase [Treponema sp.]